MSNKIHDILKLTKSTLPEASQSPIDIIELGNGYVLVHTHTQAPNVTERAEGHSGIDYFEVRHPASEQVLASLTGMAGGKEPVVKVGIILPDYKAPGMSKNIHEAMVKKYGSCSEDLLSFLKTSWGDNEESPSISASDKTGSWTKVHEVLDSLSSLKKSMMVKINGHRGWHKVNDVQDTKLPADHPHGGNIYHVIHSKTNENIAVHQTDLADLAHESELKEVSYKRKTKKSIEHKPEPIQSGSLVKAVDWFLSSKKLEKGVNRRLFPFNPRAESQESRAVTENWVSGPGGTESRDAVPQMSGNAKNRALHNLHGKTTSRKNESGEVEYLMHRGLSPTEFVAHHRGDHHETRAKTSWTPDISTASSFAETYGEGEKPGHLVSAWIPASQIHNIPKQLIGEAFGEEEAIVAPGKYRYPSDQETVSNIHSTSGYSDNSVGIKQRKANKQLRDNSAEYFQGQMHKNIPLKKFAAGAPGLSNAGLTGIAAVSKTQPVELMKASDERTQRLMAIGSETQIGIDALTGKKAYLLYRGMEQDEYKQTVEPDNRVSANKQSTWTPYPDVAMEFNPGGFLVGAWIAEENLVLQSVAPNEQLDPETNKISLYKVIVKPHESIVLSSAQTKMILEQLKG